MLFPGRPAPVHPPREKRQSLLTEGGAGLGGMKNSGRGDVRQLWTWKRSVRVPWGPDIFPRTQASGRSQACEVLQRHSPGGAPQLAAAKRQMVLAQGWAAAGCLVLILFACFSLKANCLPGLL